MPLPIDQLISLLGAALILAAFAANVFEKLNNQSAAYHWLNLVGAGCLTYTAIVGRQWGFILLEGVWTLVSVYGLVRLLRQPAAS